MTDDRAIPAYDPLPEDVASWLEGHGWQRRSQAAGVPALWSVGAQELLQPTLRDATDYDLRLAQMLRQLASMTRRPADSLAEEMIHEGSDVTEWRAAGLETRDHSVPLDDGLRLVSTVRDAFVAVANATVQRRGYFGHSTSKVAREHARTVRMGQTRRGSYIVPIISRVPGAVAVPDDGQERFDVEVSAQPFERRVMALLAEALTAIQELAVAHRAPTQKQLNESVSRGVSHELCAALESVLSVPSFGDVDVSFSWARRASSHPSVAKVILPKEAQGVIHEMAVGLRGSEVIAEQVITGRVRSHTSEPDEDVGVVFLRAPMGKTLRNVRMTLEGERLHEALLAAADKKPVFVRGRLVREQGKTWYFQSISEFGILEAAPVAWGTGLPADEE